MSFDLTKLLVTEDWFSDISPQTMRRLLNIVSVTGKCGPFFFFFFCCESQYQLFIKDQILTFSVFQALCSECLIRM